MPQYWPFSILALAAATFTSILYYSGNPAFQRYFGEANPLLVVLLAAMAGGGALSVLLNRGWFVIFKKERFRQGARAAAVLVAPLGILIIVVDSLGVFPKDINVQFPASLLFYPVMGFVVEAVFHVLPLALLLTVLTSLSPKLSFENVLWPCILLIAVAEPIFQAVLSSADHYPLWADWYVGFHIFLINLIQLWLFKRYDFVTMYTFRLMYYLIWHIGWGWLRLEALF